MLLVRRASAHLLTHSPYFGGGTISSLSLSTPFSHVPRVRPSSSSPSEASISASSAPDASKTDIHTILEAGTPPFLEIVALSHALDWLDEITQGEGLGAVSRRTKRLRDALVSQLRALRHADGSEVFVEHSAFRAGLAEGPETTDAVVLEEPGPILGFSLRLSGQLPESASSHRSDGSFSSSHKIEDYRTAFVGHVALSRLALVNGIALRSGGLCNTGAWTRIWGMGDAELCELEKSGRKCWDEGESPESPTAIFCGLAALTSRHARALIFSWRCRTRRGVCPLRALPTTRHHPRLARTRIHHGGRFRFRLVRQKVLCPDERPSPPSLAVRIDLFARSNFRDARPQGEIDRGHAV